MDFELHDTQEMAAFRREVSGFLKEIVPGNLVVSADPKDETDEQYEMRREIARRLGARGWLFPTVPKEYGGAELTMDHSIVIADELDKYELATPPYSDMASLVGPDIYVWGTEEQKKRFLPPMYTGQVVTWQVLTEPHGGSDLASTKTTAVRDGDEYVLNGTKTFVGSHRPGDQYWTLVLTDPAGPRHQNLSWILVPANLPGITVQPLNILTRPNNSVFFEDVRVPAFNLVGGENNGWKVATTHLELEHGGGGRIGRNRTLERFFEYCKTTQFNGERIASGPSAREILADIQIAGDVNRLLGLRNFWQRHARKPGTYEGSQSSYMNKMSGLRMGHEMQNILGYFAITSDDRWSAANKWVELYMRSSIVAVHPAGTQDIQRVIMARRMGLGRTVREEAGRMD